jgi:hypothetical protein
MEKAFKVTFSNGLTACAAKVHRLVELSAALRELGLHRSKPALVLVGGAGGLTNTELDRLRPLFAEVLAPLAEALGVAVVDGGTDAGVMCLMGRARAGIDARFPLIGVAAIGTIALPDVPFSPPDGTPLEPHHTHFVLVPGSEWGDESPWLARAASALANGAPSVTVLVNGGDIAWEDVSHSVEAGRPVIAIAGSGRTADRIAGALHGEIADERAKVLSASGLLQAVGSAPTFDAVARTIKESLTPKKRSEVGNEPS